MVDLARQMARGLGHAHRAGLVHRDFKPANVAATHGEDGRELVRILDFGLAIAEGDGRIGRLTEHGLVVGTPIYISPEQARDQVVDHRADLFALGVVMYEMLAGKPPFEGTSHEIARSNVTTTPPPIAQRNPAVRVSPELEAVIMKLMAKRPADRLQTADDVIAALGQLGRRAVALPVTDIAARGRRDRTRACARGCSGCSTGRRAWAGAGRRQVVATPLRGARRRRAAPGGWRTSRRHLGGDHRRRDAFGAER